MTNPWKRHKLCTSYRNSTMVLLELLVAVFLSQVRGQIWRTDNLAYRKPVGAANPPLRFPAEYAVDGDREKRIRRNSCTLVPTGEEVIWWYVNLETEYRVRQVIFVNGESGPERARMFSIKVARTIDDEAMLYNDYSNCATQEEALRPGQVKAYTCLELCIGTYVVILKTMREDLQICELEVYGMNSFGNIALGQPAITYTQFRGNTIYQGYLSSISATDGHTNSHFMDGSCTQTSNRAEIAEEWLSVDLGEEMRIRRVTVINRGDGYGFMFAKFRVRVTSDFHPWLFEKNQFLECYHQTDSLLEGEVKHMNCDYIVVGQYVLLFKYDSQSAGLNLCEMEIEATGLEPNLALKKPTLMSGETPYSERLSYRGVDGIVKGQRDAVSCIFTPGREETEWFMVDLLEIYRIRNVIIVAPGEQGACVKPMGMSRTKPEIRDDQISASSEIGQKTALHGRFLNKLKPRQTASWCGRAPDAWIQTKFDEPVVITGVTIQPGFGHEYTKTYKVGYSLDGSNFTIIQERGKDAVFKSGYKKMGHFSRTSWFNREIRMKYIRIYPITYSAGRRNKDAMCLRYELHGCKELGLALENFRIQMTSRFDAKNYPQNKFALCHEQVTPLPTSAYLPLYCRREVVGRYVIVEKRESIGSPLNFCELEVYGTQHNGNLAFGMDAAQRKTVGRGSADLVTDGITDSDQKRSKSCSLSEGVPWLSVGRNWLKIDIINDVDIGEVIVVNALDCRDRCLENFVVRVAKTFRNESEADLGMLCASFQGGTIGGEGLSLRCQEGTVGHIIVLTVDIRQDIYICEIEVYERYRYGANLALGRPTFQSSESLEETGFSYLAVDGASYGNFYQGSCSMTCAESKQAWWAVQLDRLYQVRKVMISNRRDCCAQRLHMFSIIVAKGFIPYGLNKIPTALCYQQTAPLKSGETKTLYCQNKPQGDHVVIVKPDAFMEPLTLCEVFVFGQPVQESLLENKKTFQSSDQRKKSSWKAVDGNLSPQYYDGSCSTTLGSWRSEWWAVDLVENHLIKRVVLSNRVDCCTDGLRDYVVTMSDELFPKDPDQWTPANRVCRDRRSPEYAGGDIIPLTCERNSKGRFLTIYKEGTTKESPLILCEVEAFGETSESIGNGTDLSTTDLAASQNSTDLEVLVDQFQSTDITYCVRISPVGNYAWLIVNLGSQVKISTVSLLLPGFSIKTSINITIAALPKTESSVSMWLNSYTFDTSPPYVCGGFYERPFRGQFLNVECQRIGSQVVVFSESDFSICELLVYVDE